MDIISETFNASDVMDSAEAGVPRLTSDSHVTCANYDFVMEGVAMGVLCVLGFVGNGLSIVCLSRDPSKSATPLLLISLEVADTLFLLAVLLLRVTSTVLQHVDYAHVYAWMPYLAKYVYPLALVFQMGSIYCTVLVTVNRYVTVCMPHRARWCSLRMSRIHVIIVCCFCFLFNIPRFLQFDATRHYDVTTNRTFVVTTPTDLARNQLFQILYSNLAYCLVMFLVPLGTLCALNFKLVAAFKRTQPLQNHSTKKRSRRASRSDNELTLTLIVIVLVFVVCQTPALVTQLLVVLLPAHLQGCPQPLFFYERISDLLVVTNSAVNFIVYCFCSRRYRRILLLSVCRCGSKAVTSPRDKNGHATTSARQQTKYTTVTGTPTNDCTRI